MGNHRSPADARRAPRAAPSAAAAAAAAATALALAGCPTVDLGDTPEDIGVCNPRGGRAYFDDVIWPMFVRPTNGATGCTRAGGCHVFGDGNLLGYKVTPLDSAANYRATLVQLDCGQPMNSKFLTKPLAGIDPHGGMDIFQPGAPEVQLFLDWFQ